MKLYVGVTDESWFNHLRNIQADEVNFWRPTAKTPFGVLNPGELFLFRLRAPKRVVVGGGIFISYTRLPLTVAWDNFGEKNGTSDIYTLQTLINKYRNAYDLPFDPDPFIGCVILNNTFFLDNTDWIPEPSDWRPGLVQGKSYEVLSQIGQEIRSQLIDVAKLPKTITSLILENKFSYEVKTKSNELENDNIEDETENNELDQEGERIAPEDEAGGRYGSEYLTRGRLGQGAFRVLVTEAYARRCAMTGHGALPALQASHIKPYAMYGPNVISNGILLRSDLHILFDRGYLTITPEFKIKVSPQLKDAYEYTEEYYRLEEKPLIKVPTSSKERPALEFIQWHNENIFRK